jgi:hypothetical protein
MLIASQCADGQSDESDESAERVWRVSEDPHENGAESLAAGVEGPTLDLRFPDQQQKKDDALS